MDASALAERIVAAEDDEAAAAAAAASSSASRARLARPGAGPGAPDFVFWGDSDSDSDDDSEFVRRTADELEEDKVKTALVATPAGAVAVVSQTSQQQQQHPAYAAISWNEPHLADQISVWNANDMFAFNLIDTSPAAADTASLLSSSAGTDEPESPEQFRERTDALIGKLLDLPFPVLNDQMLEFLNLEGVVEAFFAIITRLPEDKKPAEQTQQETTTQATSSNATSTETAPSTGNPLFDLVRAVHARGPRDTANTEATRRSFQAMEIIASRAMPNTRFVAANLRKIAHGLLQVFNPVSDGNFHHLKKTYERLIDLDESAALGVLFFEHCPETHLPHIFRALPYIHVSPVQEFLINAIFQLPKEEGAGKRKDRFTHLQTMEFVETLVSLVDLADVAPAVVEGCGEFFVRLVDECVKADDAHILFMALECDVGVHVGKLLDIAQRGPAVIPEFQYNAAVNMLHALINRTNFRRVPMSPLDTTVYPVILDALRRASITHVCAHMPQLCRLVAHPTTKYAEMHLPGHITLAVPFSTNRLKALEIVHDVVATQLDVQALSRARSTSSTRTITAEDNHEDKAADSEDKRRVIDASWLREIPFELLFGWVADYKYNTQFHAVMYKILSAVIRAAKFYRQSGAEPGKGYIDEFLYAEPLRLVDRLIDLYESDETRAHLTGYVVLVGNTIRLSSEIPAHACLRGVLSANTRWAAFLPRLLDETLKQVRFSYRFEIPGLKRPPPYVSPLFGFGLPGGLSLSASSFMDDRLDQGSFYSRQLGFSEPSNTATPNVTDDAEKFFLEGADDQGVLDMYYSANPAEDLMRLNELIASVGITTGEKAYVTAPGGGVDAQVPRGVEGGGEGSRDAVVAAVAEVEGAVV